MHLWILYRIAALLFVPLENQHAAFCKFHERRLGRIHKLRCRVHWIQCLAEANQNDQPLTKAAKLACYKAQQECLKNKQRPRGTLQSVLVCPYPPAMGEGVELDSAAQGPWIGNDTPADSGVEL